LAISVPATAGPGGQKGGKDRAAATVQHGGGATRAKATRAERQTIRSARTERAAIERPQRAERVTRHAERQQARPQRTERAQLRAERQEARPNRVERQQARTADRQQARANRIDRVESRQANRQQLRVDRVQRAQERIAQRQLVAGNKGVGYGVGGCPPGLAGKGCMPPGQAALQGLRTMAVPNRVAALRNLGDARFSTFDLAPQRQILAPAAATALLGMPLTTAASVASFSPFPQTVQYLYPSTPDYYYQYGNGYGYQIDRSTNLIAALIPLLAGGYMPGSYLPASYMNSYVPSYYGLNSFYPASYGNDICNRYMNGVVYQVDCYTGMVENVMPMYASGYGVGQLLPSSYSYYNVPMQYRSMYYNTADAGYWYSPGAIYQYDPSSSLITSVAALMTPGFTVGQQLPMGYGMYNVPLSYRATYYDTPDAWYRYNNGYIYRVDPATQLVAAVVASVLT
jgi:hypothetical protein